MFLLPKQLCHAHGNLQNPHCSNIRFVLRFSSSLFCEELRKAEECKSEESSSELDEEEEEEEEQRQNSEADEEEEGEHTDDDAHDHMVRVYTSVYVT